VTNDDEGSAINIDNGKTIRREANSQSMIFKTRIIYCLAIFIYSSLSVAAVVMGDQVCISCHAKEHKQWQGSQHQQAMQEASAQTVLGDFKQAKFTHHGVNTRFFMRNGRFMVNTDGPDDQLQNYEISYTFGVYPLQQYLVKFPQGRMQVLDIAWDSRSKAEGGQRWFSLHPDEIIKADDVLHWTGPNLNWNFMCADCHSTNLKKNYDLVNRSYKTRWDAINVSFEACHGAASEHIAWNKAKNSTPTPANKGFSMQLSAASLNRWQIDPQTQKPELDHQAEAGEKIVQLCAKCHSRRAQLDDQFIPGDDFRDHYLPALLTDSLYYPDGKIKDEVYVYGSFKQSRMYQAGVICSDCHQSHTLALKAPGDQVCQQCHAADSYANQKHHLHKQQSAGASCISCHMPAKVYMGVDVRNDHSFRIPRPDLAAELSLPDACSNCHKDKTKLWAAAIIKQRFGKTPTGYQRFGKALYALEKQDSNALSLAYDVLKDEAPGIAKASVLAYLGNYPSRQTLTTCLQMLRSSDADIRRQALQTLQGFPLQHTVAQIFPLLRDPVKMVRLEAARILAAVPKGALPKSQADLIAQVTEEYRQSLLFNAERPAAQLSLAQLYSNQGKRDNAETAFKEALLLQPKFVPGYVNYAHFLQSQGREKQAFDILQRAMPGTEDAAVYHALGFVACAQSG
jgi:tetratricopeptide (TPR) repeat protein